MTFLPNPAYDPATQSQRQAEVNPGYMRNPAEMIIDVTDLADNDAHYKYVDMDGFDNIGVQVECSYAADADTITFSLDDTLDPETDPTDSGIQWTADTDCWGSGSINNSSAAIDRMDKIKNCSPTWFRFTYQRTATDTTRCSFQIKIKRWKS